MTEKKLDERLNEMARRLNKANQSNELRFRTMSTEYENMKVCCCFLFLTCSVLNLICTASPNTVASGGCKEGFCTQGR